MDPLLDTRRLAEQADGHGAALFAAMAGEWAATIPASVAEIRAAAAADLPDALHRFRSGAVAAGLRALPGALARAEQRAEAGDTVGSGDLDALAALAEDSVEALTGWWRRAGW